MKIFITGATGFIGSALVPEFINAGHQVLGLTRSDTGAAAPGQVATEDYYNSGNPNPRQSTESAGAVVADRGVHVSVVRLSQVHNTVKQGFISQLIRVARDKGISAYIGEGANRWPAAHVLDVARLYRLALEKHTPGSRYNAVAEEGLPMRQIAQAIGKSLKIPVVSLSPEDATSHFGWLTMFAAMDMPASSLQTRQRLGWRPVGPELFSDLEQLQPAP